MERITDKRVDVNLEYVSKLSPELIERALKKLQDYENKEEDGSLKVIPCPIHTIVHEPYRFLGVGSWEIEHHEIGIEDLDKIGKTVFIDEADAKEYIKRKEECND